MLQHCNQQWIAFCTVVRKEVTRFMRIWPQSLVPPMITSFLYFLIFGHFLGNTIGQMQGMNYSTFIIPGFIMMAMIQQSYANVSSSFFSDRFQNSHQEMVISPMLRGSMLLGFVIGGTARAMIVGCLVFLIALGFGDANIAHPVMMLYLALCTCFIFSALGFINGCFARKFDDIAIIPSFILTPMTYLGGVFYSINYLPKSWQIICHLNPIYYIVSTFRYGMLGDGHPDTVLFTLIITGFMLLSLFGAYYVVMRGIGIKD